MNKEMKACERFRAVLEGKPNDRSPMIEWAPWWNLTLNNWRKEGLPEGIEANWDIQRHFGQDINLQYVFSPFTVDTPFSKLHGQGMLKNESDYEKILPTLFPEPFISDEIVKTFTYMRDKGEAITWFTVFGYFWLPRDLFGIEDHLYSFYDEPELYKRICGDNHSWLKKVFEYAANRMKFDFMTFAEDMSYNNGPMISESQFDEFILPNMQHDTKLLKSLDIHPIVDSDGDITNAVDWYCRAGAEGMLPLERQAGVDVSIYIDKHPDLTFIGHFDKMVMDKGEEAIRTEFERLLPSAQRGKLIMSVDHQTPPAVSYDDYLIYMRLFSEYAVKAAKK